MPKGQRKTEQAKARIGEKYGLLTIADWIGSDDGRKSIYRFVCECGGECVRTLVSVKRGGQFASCGCSRYIGAALHHLKHGGAMRGATMPEYVVWSKMKDRCLSGSARDARWYKDKGIKVCERWMKFENFIADMGRRPGPGYDIDRVDPDGDYCPENCRWLPSSENRRRSAKARWERENAGAAA